MALIEQIASSGSVARRLRLRSPASLEVIGEIDVLDATQVWAAVERARKAQREWAERLPSERARVIERALRILVERADEAAEILVRETGKPVFEAVTSEIVSACDFLQYFAKRAEGILKDRTLRMHLLWPKQLRISYRPLGVVGIIIPWNFPLQFSVSQPVQALLAGNAVLLKPSEATPFSALFIEKVFHDAGLADGLFQVLTGDGETGAALLEAGVDKISFTGSVRTGRKVGEICGRNLIPCTLELGGKDPMIVCADADLERAVGGAVYGSFLNAGQACCSVERIYVVESVADEFIARVCKKVATLRQGTDGESDIGPMIYEPQLRTVDEHVREAVAKGAKILAGGRRNPNSSGLFYEPTVLIDVTHEMQVMREETFGPVLAIMRVQDENEAIHFANDTRYGLNSSVWTRDKAKGVELAKRIHAGCCLVNDCLITYGAAESPFGGRKESGVGQVNGEQGLRSYTFAQSIIVDRLGAKEEMAWYPYTAEKLQKMKRALRGIWGTALGRFLS